MNCVVCDLKLVQRFVHSNVNGEDLYIEEVEAGNDPCKEGYDTLTEGATFCPQCRIVYDSGCGYELVSAKVSSNGSGCSPTEETE